MQDALTTSHTWFQTALNYVLGAGTLGFIATLIRLWLNRKKPRAEIDLTDAQKEKTLAEARSLDVSSNKTASEVLLDLIHALTEKQRESLELEEKAAKFEAANKLLAEQNAHLNHVLRLNGIKYDGSTTD